MNQIVSCATIGATACSFMTTSWQRTTTSFIHLTLRSLIMWGIKPLWLQPISRSIALSKSYLSYQYKTSFHAFKLISIVVECRGISRITKSIKKQLKLERRLKYMSQEKQNWSKCKNKGLLLKANQECIQSLCSGTTYYTSLSSQ